MGKIIRSTRIKLNDSECKELSIEVNGGLKNEKNQVYHLQTKDWRIQFTKKEFNHFKKAVVDAVEELEKYKSKNK